MIVRKFLVKTRKWLNKKAKESLRWRGLIRFGMNKYRLLRYKVQTLRCPVDEHIVLFASFGGTSYSDNPKALFQYMLTSGKFINYTFVWGFKKGLPAQRKRMKSRVRAANIALNEQMFPDRPEFDDEGRKIPNIKLVPKVVVVKHGGKTWRKYQARAKYWVLNYKVDDYLKPKKEQIFLQTWHGTPLKRLGYDLEHFDNALNTTEGIQKRYKIEVQKFDYFISPSPFATKKFKSAWRMEAAGKSDIMLEVGYPRNDILYNYTEEDVQRIKKRIFGFYYLPYEKYIKKKTIVLYAPTYRSDQHTSGVGYTYHEELDFDKMQEVLGEDFIILFRAHYFVASKFNFKKYEGFVYNVSKVGDINDLYLISDMLITDYSSSMFDYANLKRPMIFYMYDLEHYRDESNGFYFSPEKVLPGPIVKTQDELMDSIQDLSKNFVYDEKYKKFNERFDPWDDGHVCERVVKAVFNK